MLSLIIGSIGCFLITIQFGTQIFQILSTKKTDDLSLSSNAILLFQGFLWTTFFSIIYIQSDYSSDNLIAVISNSFIIFFTGIILILKRIYDTPVVTDTCQRKEEEVRRGYCFKWDL